MATVFSAPAVGTRQKHGQLTQSLLCQEIRVSQRPPEFVLCAPLSRVEFKVLLTLSPHSVLGKEHEPLPRLTGDISESQGS